MISRDERFLQRLQEIVEEHMSDRTFGVKSLSDKMKVSEPNLWKKVHRLTQMNPNQFIRQQRLQKASQMLYHDVGTVQEIAHAVGFNNKSYFAKCFQEQFGVPPSKYRRASVPHLKGGVHLNT